MAFFFNMLKEENCSPRILHAVNIPIKSAEKIMTVYKEGKSRYFISFGSTLKE